MAVSYWDGRGFVPVGHTVASAVQFDPVSTSAIRRGMTSHAPNSDHGLLAISELNLD